MKRISLILAALLVLATLSCLTASATVPTQYVAFDLGEEGFFVPTSEELYRMFAKDVINADKNGICDGFEFDGAWDTSTNEFSGPATTDNDTGIGKDIVSLDLGIFGKYSNAKWGFLRDWLVSKVGSAAGTDPEAAKEALVKFFADADEFAVYGASSDDWAEYYVDSITMETVSKFYVNKNGTYLVGEDLPVPHSYMGEDFYGWFDNAELVGTPLTTVTEGVDEYFARFGEYVEPEVGETTAEEGTTDDGAIHLPPIPIGGETTATVETDVEETLEEETTLGNTEEDTVTETEIDTDAVTEEATEEATEDDGKETETTVSQDIDPIAESEEVSEEATEAVTEAATEAATEAVTEAATEATTEEATEKETIPAKKKGCGSVIGAGLSLILLPVVVYGVRKKRD